MLKINYELNVQVVVRAVNTKKKKILFRPHYIAQLCTVYHLLL